MKIAVGQGCVPTYHHVAADADFLLAKQQGIGEAAVIADDHARLFAQGEMHAVHRAMPANDQRRFQSAAEAMEKVIAAQHGVRAEADIGRQLAVQPAAVLAVSGDWWFASGNGHEDQPLAVVGAGSVLPNWSRYSCA